MPLFSGPGRKVAFSLSPPIFAGGMITVVLYRAGLTNAIPGSLVVALWNRRGYRRDVFGQRRSHHGRFVLWRSERSIFCPAGFADWFMAAGFGGLHIVFGVIIARRYGG